jgi:ferrous iron transport protein B
MEPRITVALAGNPNAGKTTIFNRLTGSRQKVGNWGGVTVDKKEGRLVFAGHPIHIVDLPGTYSLTAYSIEEIIARNYILDEKPDVVVNVVDASNLERNLYLTTQLIELGAHLVLALTMTDLAKDKGLTIDTGRLSEIFGAPVVEVVGTTGQGMDELLDTVVAVAGRDDAPKRRVDVHYVKEIEEEIETIRSILDRDASFSLKNPTRWVALKLLEEDANVTKLVTETASTAALALAAAESAGHRITSRFDDDPAGLIVDRRYGFVAGAVREAVRLGIRGRVDVTKKIDAVLLNRILGFPILLFFMWLMFQLTFTVGDYPTRWLSAGVQWLGGFLHAALPGGFLTDLVADGIVPGMGGVLVFVPNIFILYLIISIFEDSGYMARAAFVMDKVMHALGLHGKSFIPMVMGFGCNVPAIIATRTLESRRDRIVTILINPLVSCSARLPVYVLLAGTFFPKHAGNVIVSIYLLGIVLAFALGKLFGRTIFRTADAPFVMELPPYRLPTVKGTLIHMWEQGSLFVRKMTTVILVGSVIIWLLSTFPAGITKDRPSSPLAPAGGATLVIENPAAADAALVPHGDSPQRHEPTSYLERIGVAIEPIFVPLGFPWEASVALLSGFVAKEIVVSTFGVLYGAGEKASIGAAMIAGGWVPAAAYAFMVFVLLYTPCLATVSVIRREVSTAVAAFSVGYSLVLAWIVAFVAYRVGLLVGLG